MNPLQIVLFCIAVPTFVFLATNIISAGCLSTIRTDWVVEVVIECVFIIAFVLSITQNWG